MSNNERYVYKLGTIYRHFKGQFFYIVGLATHSETGEELVIYRHEGDLKLYARPRSMFESKVDKEKYPQATQEYRFERYQGAVDK